MQTADSWVFYRRPVTSEIIHLTGQARVVTGNAEWFRNKGFVVAPFDRSMHKTWFIDTVRTVPVHTEYEMLELFNDGITLPSVSSFVKPWREIPRREYISLIRQLKQEIEDTELEKVVLSRVINIKGVKPDKAVRMFIDLCVNYPNAFVFLFYLPEVGLWMGATPETLMTAKDDRFKIVSLAGTANWMPHLTFEQLWNKKEREEQQMVTDFVKKVIYDSGIDNYEMRGPETFRAGNLSHLRTIFRFETEDYSLIDRLLDKLHPTPAVCGLPQDKAKEIIRDIELYSRSYYAGFIGPVCDDGMSLYVNLRSLQFTDNGVQLFVGGGITGDSEPEAEWKETEMKAQTLLAVIK